MDSVYAVRFLGALFAVMNPLAILPVFLSLTANQNLAEQRRTALLVIVSVTAMSAVLAVTGLKILDFFGISVDGFRVAGGLVIGGIALNMLNGESSPSHAGSDREKPHLAAADNIAFYPLSFPMVVGPGTIATLVVFLQQADGFADHAVYAAVLATVLAVTGVTLWFAASIGARLSRTLRTIMSRLMGMILLAIAVEMVVAGALALLPGLAA